jgi:CSLREA domain-containing protein
LRRFNDLQSGWHLEDIDSTADDLDPNGNCTLREAIEAANTNAAVDGFAAGEAPPTVDVIQVSAGVYDLTLQGGPGVEDANQEGELEILEEVDIVGAGADLTAIDGQATERVLDFRVPVSTVLSTLTGVEVRNGFADNGVGGGQGGGIQLPGNLFIYSCRITGNTANNSAGRWDPSHHLGPRAGDLRQRDLGQPHQ